MSLLKMGDLPLQGKRVMFREDFNVPLEAGRITSDARLQAALPGIRQALTAGAQILLLSHLGRPEEGHVQPEFSLAPVAVRLAQLLAHPVRLVPDWLNGVNFEKNEIILCENVRFNVGEKKNDDALAQQMAALCDIFVMDAFATAHRAEASTHGVAKYAPVACAGPLLLAELTALSKVLEHPQRPLIAIVGGSKVSTKLEVLEQLLHKVDQLIVGGGIANTFLAATGKNIGESLCEKAFIPVAKRLMQIAEVEGRKIHLPVDVVVAETFAADAAFRITTIEDIRTTERILDIGPKTATHYAQQLQLAGTILWNGPVGVFEFPAFSKGTQALAEAIAKSAAYSLAGGGDTVAAIEQFGVEKAISYISTGGGAFLEFVEGKTLPAVEILQQRAVNSSHFSGN